MTDHLSPLGPRPSATRPKERGHYGRLPESDATTRRNSIVMSDPTQHPLHTPPNSVAAVKEQSNYPRGAIAAELDGDSDHFTMETAQLLRHHGIYQQDDRDHHPLAGTRLGENGTRKQQRYQFMVRTVRAVRKAR